MSDLLGVIVDRDTLFPGDLDLGRIERSLPQWRVFGMSDRSQLVERLEGAQVAVTNKVGFDAELIERLPQLRLICVSATGVNNIDLDAAVRRGLRVCNVKGYSTDSVAQHVFTLVLALIGRVRDYDGAVRRGRWSAQEMFCLLDYPIAELASKTLGIVGYGDIGRAVERIGAAFGMRVVVAQRRGAEVAPDRVPLDQLLEQVDVLTLHCPLTPATRGLIGASELARMKSSAVLINTARGALVDEAALAQALRAGRLGGAGVDVLSAEPPPATNPLLATDMPNLLVTPHVAWATREARQRLVDEVAQNIEAFLAGAPRNVVA